jgi:hypothetical protein
MSMGGRRSAGWSLTTEQMDRLNAVSNPERVPYMYRTVSLPDRPVRPTRP